MRFGVFSVYSTDLYRNSLHMHGTYENIISIKKKGSRIHLYFPFLFYGKKYFKIIYRSFKKFILEKQFLDMHVI